jgi:hypothetical protein
MENSGRSWSAFLRLWFVLLLSYSTLKFIFNVVVVGYIDLRPVAFWELLALPFGQAIVVRLITRGRFASSGRR